MPELTVLSTLLGFAFAIFGLELPAWLLPHATHAGQARVIDGDSLEIDGARIRLIGIDAPELGQSCRAADGAVFACGQSARDALQGFIAARPVTCREFRADKYRRALARCSVGGADLAAWMVSRGWAMAYAGRDGDPWRATEGTARDTRAGLWAGGFERPEDWRRAQRAAAR
jgi:endonuclease YncB( thermonuclease family)